MKQGATIDCYASSVSYQVPLATLTGLDPATSHTVTVKVLGTKNAASQGTTIIFDAFETRQLASFTDSYAYDLASRVTSWTRSGEGATHVTYGYDAAGNLDTLTRDSVTTVFTQDADNRLTLAVTGSSVTTYTNDLYGRRTSEITSEDPSATAVATTYTWDAMGHLTGVSLDDGAAVCTNSYGASGMRESASVTEGSTTSTTKSFWLGSALTAEIDSAGGVNGTRYDYLWRPDGTPLALAVTPSGGATSVFHYQTDAYGEVLTATGYGANAALAERNPLRYRGYYYDTATGLYYLPVRYYDPGTCRFLSADPAGPSAGDPLTLNAYAYCVGDPVNLEDPSGAIIDADGDGRASVADVYSHNYIHESDVVKKAARRHAMSGAMKDTAQGMNARGVANWAARTLAVEMVHPSPVPSDETVDYYRDCNFSVSWFTCGVVSNYTRNWSYSEVTLNSRYVYFGPSAGLAPISGSVMVSNGATPPGLYYERVYGAGLGRAEGSKLVWQNLVVAPWERSGAFDYVQEGGTTPQAGVSLFWVVPVNLN